MEIWWITYFIIITYYFKVALLLLFLIIIIRSKSLISAPPIRLYLGDVFYYHFTTVMFIFLDENELK